jgi:hypothetical protein
MTLYTFFYILHLLGILAALNIDRTFEVDPNHRALVGDAWVNLPHSVAGPYVLEPVQQVHIIIRAEKVTIVVSVELCYSVNLFRVDNKSLFSKGQWTTRMLIS